MSVAKTTYKGGRSGVAGVAFAIPLFLFVCNAIPLYRYAFKPYPTPRLTFQYTIWGTMNYDIVLCVCFCVLPIFIVDDPLTALCPVQCQDS